MKNLCTLLGLALTLCTALPASAGMFRITAVWYDVSDSPVVDCYKQITVPATAKYFGPVDDYSWFIQTSLNHTANGGSLTNWNPPDWLGAGKNGGSGIFTGMEISCNASCAANGVLEQPPCGSSPIYYKGHAAVTSSVINGNIDIMDAPTEQLECCNGGCPQAAQGRVTYLSLRDEGDLVVPTTSVLLRRRETLGGITYLMEEWAVVSFSDQGTAAPLATVLRSSSDAFGSVQSPDLALVLRAARPAPDRITTVLVIAEPIHPHNRRHISAPAARLAETRLPFREEAGQLIVRADFSEDRRLQDLQVLHATGSVSPDLHDFLARHLELVYHSDKQHRVILFAVLDVGEEGVELQQSRTLLPRCCCPEWPFCPI